MRRSARVEPARICVARRSAAAKSARRAELGTDVERGHHARPIAGQLGDRRGRALRGEHQRDLRVGRQVLDHRAGLGARGLERRSRRRRPAGACWPSRRGPPPRSASGRSPPADRSGPRRTGGRTPAAAPSPGRCARSAAARRAAAAARRPRARRAAGAPSPRSGPVGRAGVRCGG